VILVISIFRGCGNPADREKRGDSIPMAVNKLRELRSERRKVAVRMVNTGIDVTTVAKVIGVSRCQVYRWLKRSQDGRDLSALEDRVGRGRPRQWSKRAQRVLEEALQHEPYEYGYQAMSWTALLLQIHVSRLAGTDLSENTLRSRLKEMGYRWKRPRYSLAADPEREKKASTAQKSPKIGPQMGIAVH
jgi:transposase